MSERPTTVVEQIGLGRALVMDSDPDGNVAVHERVKTRQYELMHETGTLTDDQWLACHQLRENWIIGRLTSDVRAGGHIPGEKGDKAAAAWTRHDRCMKAMGQISASVLQAVVLHDEEPSNLGRRMAKPLTRLENALDMLVVYCNRGHLDKTG